MLKKKKRRFLKKLQNIQRKNKIRHKHPRTPWFYHRRTQNHIEIIKFQKISFFFRKKATFTPLK